MKRPSNIEVLQTLLERTPQALQKAAEAEAAGLPGKALYYRTIAHEAATVYAWMVGDDARAAVEQGEKRALNRAIDAVDQQMSAYRDELPRLLAVERSLAYHHTADACGVCGMGDNSQAEHAA